MTTSATYPLAFTTLACPDWTWDQIVRRATEYGYQGVELRGVEGEMDLTRARPFARDTLAATRRELAERGLAIPCLDASCRFDDAAEIDKNVEEGKRHIDLAAELEAPYIRVFGDRISDAAARERVIGQVIEGVQALARHAQGTGVTVLLESHGDFARSQNILAVMRAVEHPHAAALWDVHHPFKFFGEPVAETYQSLKPYIRHVHLKDSVPGTGADGGVRYCLLGQGIMPVEEVIGLLRDGDYQGWIAFEWEKRWHPEIEEPEVALAAFIRTFRDAEVAAAGRRQNVGV